MRKLIHSSSETCLDKHGLSTAYANLLLEDLGVNVKHCNLNTHGRSERESAENEEWVNSGLASLTGFPAGPVEHCPAPLAECADGVLQAFEQLSGRDLPGEYGAAKLLTQRAAMLGLERRGNISPGGSCRILPAADGHIAINLPRVSDWQLLPAWLQSPTSQDWPGLAAALSGRKKNDLIAQGRTLGLAISDAAAQLPAQRCWYAASFPGLSKKRTSDARSPRVVDLSSLWAGPLCSRLLDWAGAEVIKVESSQRPDSPQHGHRKGIKEFYNFLNAGKQQQYLALDKESGRTALRRLIATADIVIEGSRPRALRQMGIVAEEVLATQPGLTWVSISGYGRAEPEANWIAYGDDAGVAGGLTSLLHKQTGQWMFCGDAIADPLTGLHAALAALASWKSGGGHLVSLSLVGTIQHCVQFDRLTKCSGYTDARQKDDVSVVTTA